MTTSCLSERAVRPIPIELANEEMPSMQQTTPFSATALGGEYAMADDRCSQPVDILLVEDSPTDADLMRDALKSGTLSVNVCTLEDGEAAMQFLRREGSFQRAKRPDLILLDLHLPRKNGYEVLSELKENEELRRIPVVILTSSQDDEVIQTAYDYYANCCITKPIDPGQFVDAVKKIEAFWISVAARLRNS